LKDYSFVLLDWNGGGLGGFPLGLGLFLGGFDGGG
jgi:hypothetical protein